MCEAKIILTREELSVFCILMRVTEEGIHSLTWDSFPYLEHQTAVLRTQKSFHTNCRTEFRLLKIFNNIETYLFSFLGCDCAKISLLARSSVFNWKCVTKSTNDTICSWALFVCVVFLFRLTGMSSGWWKLPKKVEKKQRLEIQNGHVRKVWGEDPWGRPLDMFERKPRCMWSGEESTFLFLSLSLLDQEKAPKHPPSLWRGFSSQTSTMGAKKLSSEDDSIWATQNKFQAKNDLITKEKNTKLDTGNHGCVRHCPFVTSLTLFCAI